MKRLLLCLATLSLVATSGAGVSALADPPTPDNPAGSHGDILGVVPAHNQARPGGGGASNLNYYGGPVLHNNHTYAIYWLGGTTASPNYQNVINGYFNNVAAATGNTSSNVYFSDRQYYDNVNGNIVNTALFNGAITDPNPYPQPSQQCNDGVAQTTVCVTDAQIQQQVAAMAPSGAPSDSIFFVFTGPNVGSCYDSTHCAFSYYCAYHSSFGSKPYYYANQPYVTTVPSACDTGQHPNGDAADGTLNVVSHEHNESITDPQGNAWFDRRGQENGDKCAWNFGTVSGPSGSEYNQTINGGHYYLQQEWSNAHSRCVLTGT